MAKKRNPKKSAKKKGKKRAPVVATRRSTGGLGFDFEDHVAAWLLLQSLTGRPLPGIEGAGKRLQMQTGTLGWVIDDVLFTTTDATLGDRHIAVSCKSNLQVSSSGLPAEFTALAWQVWAKTDDPMHRVRDCLALATQGRHPAFDAAWSALKSVAPGSDLAFAVAQMRATGNHRKIFDGIKAAASTAKITVSDADVVSLIRHVEVLPFDFGRPSSQSERTVAAEARALLANCLRALRGS